MEDLTQWCYENPKEAAMTIEVLESELKKMKSMFDTKCKCGKGHASKVDGLCKFCREKLVSRTRAKKAGVRNRGDGMTVNQYQRMINNQREQL